MTITQLKDVKKCKHGNYLDTPCYDCKPLRNEPPRRGPNDGLPYYCNACGAGWNEFLACENLCELESPEKAANRRVKWLSAMAAKRGTHYRKRAK